MKGVEIVGRSYSFGVKIVKICLNFPKSSVGFGPAGQLVRSGTSVGANVEETQDAMSRADFLKSMNIALKEARETNYWLRIVGDSGILEKGGIADLLDESMQLVKILTSIVRSTKSRL